MKKLLFISVLFLAVASTVYAQAPRTPDPQQQAVIRNAQSRYINSTNDKNKPHLKPTDLNRVAKQNDQVMREQEIFAYTPTPQVRKDQKSISKEAKNLKRTREQAKRDKVVSKRKDREEQATVAKRRLAYAQSAKEDAMRAFTALLDRQMKEMAELQERHKAEAATGLTQEMSQRHERELQELNTEQARQLMEAQKVVDEASRKYEEAMEKCN